VQCHTWTGSKSGPASFEKKSDEKEVAETCLNQVNKSRKFLIQLFTVKRDQIS